MFESRTYEALLASALSRVASPVDKREGSMVMNGVAPSMAELAQLYIAADFVLQATYIITAPREYLIKRAHDRNMDPYPASSAVYRAEFNIEVPEGTRFSCEDLNFVVTARMDPEEDTETGLSYQVTCETPGAAANNYGGTLIPVEYVQGLTHAELVELLIPGDDEEETEAFRQRVLDSFQSQAFGGNQADYREKVLAMPGVGDLKIHPVWNGDISPASLIPDEYKAPTPTLLEEIQTAIDPEQNAGEGLGLAPIGHVVHVTGVTPEEVDIALHLTYASGWDWDAVKSYVEAVIDAYFVELSQDWATSDFLTVRISQIESRILSECSNMITDIGGTKINGQENNLALGPDSIPARGEVTDG